jgi:hypothetical protein
MADQAGIGMSCKVRFKGEYAVKKVRNPVM